MSQIAFQRAAASRLVPLIFQEFGDFALDFRDQHVLVFELRNESIASLVFNFELFFEMRELELSRLICQKGLHSF